MMQSTVEALLSGHPRDVKKVSVTGAGGLLVRMVLISGHYRSVRDSWPLTGACQANNKHWKICKKIPPY